MAGAAGIKKSMVAHGNWCRGRANRCGEPDNLFDGLALHVQADEESRDLSVGTFSGQHFVHDRARLVTRERFAVAHNAMQGFEDHAVQRLYGKERVTLNQMLLATRRSFLLFPVKLLQYVERLFLLTAVGDQSFAIKVVLNSRQGSPRSTEIHQHPRRHSRQFWNSLRHCDLALKHVHLVFLAEPGRGVSM